MNRNASCDNNSLWATLSESTLFANSAVSVKESKQIFIKISIWSRSKTNRIYHQSLMQTEKSQPKVNGWCWKRGLLSFQHYPLTRRLGFRGLHQRPLIDYFSYPFTENRCFKKIFTINVVWRPTPNIIWRSSLWRVSNVCKQLTSLLVSRELSQPMGKTEFSSSAKYRTNSVSQTCLKFLSCLLTETGQTRHNRWCQFFYICQLKTVTKNCQWRSELVINCL